MKVKVISISSGEWETLKELITKTLAREPNVDHQDRNFRKKIRPRGEVVRRVASGHGLATGYAMVGPAIINSAQIQAFNNAEQRSPPTKSDAVSRPCIDTVSISLDGLRAPNNHISGV